MSFSHDVAVAIVRAEGLRAADSNGKAIVEKIGQIWCKILIINCRQIRSVRFLY